jgi:hypothetical protein
MLYQDERQEIDIAEEAAEETAGTTPLADAAEKAEVEADREAEKDEVVEAHVGEEAPA